MQPTRGAEAVTKRPAQAPLRPLRERTLLILWPAFVMAGMLEILVFAVVDPTSLQWFGAEPIEASRCAIYSVTFFIFWGAIASSGAITQWLALPESVA